MGFLSKLIVKIILNAIALYIAQKYLAGFILSDGLTTLLIGGAVLTLLNTFIRPILKLISFPFIFITFGLFNLVINLVILWFADQLLTQLTITNFSSLFWASIIVALANAFL